MKTTPLKTPPPLSPPPSVRNANANRTPIHIAGCSTPKRRAYRLRGWSEFLRRAFVALAWLSCFGGGLAHGATTQGATATNRWRPAHRKNRDPKVLTKVLRPRRFALVIGINEYNDKHWPTLRYAARDARRVQSHLRKFGGFDRIQRLIDPKATSRKALIRGLRLIKQWNQSPLDTIVVYISSHGTIAYSGEDRIGQRYVVTSDTQANIPKTALSVRFIRSFLERLPSRRKMLMLATCYTGDAGSKSRLPLGQKGNVSVQAASRSRTMLILSASSFRQPAFESHALKSDVYTHFFLRCLRKFATHPAMPISASYIHTCAVGPTFRYVKQKFGQFQLPGLESRIDGLDAVYLAGHRPTLNTASKTKQRRGFLQIFGHTMRRWKLRFYRIGRKSSVASLQLENDQLIALPPGHYRIVMQAQHGAEEKQFDLQLKAGQRMSLNPPAFFVELEGGVISTSIASVPIQYGGSVAFSWSFVGIRLGFWSGQGQHSSNTLFQQHQLDLTLEMGWRPSFGLFGFFLGGYAGAGWIFQDHETGLRSGPLLQYGALFAPTLRLTPRLHLTLPLRAGFSVASPGQNLQNIFGWSLRLGLQYNF